MAPSPTHTEMNAIRPAQKSISLLSPDWSPRPERRERWRDRLAKEGRRRVLLLTRLTNFCGISFRRTSAVGWAFGRSRWRALLWSPTRHDRSWQRQCPRSLRWRLFGGGCLVRLRLRYARTPRMPPTGR